MNANLESKSRQAADQLDAHVREIVNWHFSPETGCPFWLEWAKKAGVDPRKEVHSFADLKKLGHFEDEWLRGGPVRRWLPKGLAGKPVYVFETGGSTGVPKSRLQVNDWRTDYEQFSTTLSDKTFPKGADWLMLGPSGALFQLLKLSAMTFVDCMAAWLKLAYSTISRCTRSPS